MREFCEVILFPETRTDPVEFCGDDVVEGSEFCARHVPAEPWEEGR